MVRTNQGGSILSFIVIGGVMVLLLVGGAYLIRHNFFPAETGPQVVTSEENDDASEKTQEENQPAPAPNNEQKEGTNAPAQPAPPNNTNDSTNQNKAAVAPPVPAPAPSTGVQPSNGLPETGPSDAFVAGLMLSGLVALSVVYVQSRRIISSL